MSVRDPHPPSATRWAPPSPAMRARGIAASGLQPLSRTAGEGAERSEAGEGVRQSIYQICPRSAHAQQKCSPVPPILDRRRAAYVVGAAGSAPDAIQVSQTTPNRGLHRRFRVHPARVSRRTRRWPALGQCGGCPPNRMARKSGLEDNPFLEQRCSQQYRGCGRDYLKGSPEEINPHPPSALRWAPPSPAVQERG
jgi:hypothetical protein